jgi:general stress protein 26
MQTTTTAMEHLTELIETIDVAMLTTVDRTGRLHSRPMMTLRAMPEGALWFFTQGSSHIVDDVHAHHPVNIGYVDSSRGRYVSVSGRARVITDRGRKQELWERRLTKWIPNGAEDPSVVLIRVELQEAEFWEWPGQQEITATIDFQSGTSGGRNEKIVFQA